MELNEFSPEQRDRADAFIKAFSKKPLKGPEFHIPENGLAIKEPVPLPKPQPKAMIVDPDVADVAAGPEPTLRADHKVAFGAEYNALKLQEEEEKEKPLHSRRPPAKKGGFFLFLIFIITFSALLLSLYNYDSITHIKGEQLRILNNQKVLFDKLARLGQRRR